MMMIVSIFMVGIIVKHILLILLNKLYYTLHKYSLAKCQRLISSSRRIARQCLESCSRRSLHIKIKIVVIIIKILIVTNIIPIITTTVYIKKSSQKITKNKSYKMLIMTLVAAGVVCSSSLIMIKQSSSRP